MGTRAEGTRDTIRNAAPAVDSPLLDVLPQHAAIDDGAARSLAFALPSDVAAALQRDGARDLLVAALVSVEAWLSGADGIVATVRAADAWKQVRVAADIEAAGVALALEVADIADVPQPCVWTVTSDAARVPDFAASCWHL